MNLYQKLSLHNKVFDPQHCNNAEFLSAANDCLTTDVFVTPVNDMSESGEMVNIDGTGNHISGSLFGYQKVYFILGINKIVSN